MSSKHDSTVSGNASNSPPARPSVGEQRTTAGGVRRIGRRTFLKGIGAAGAGAVGLSVDGGFARDAEALAPLLAAGGAAVTLGWALREFEVIGSDPPPEGLTPAALEQSAFQTLKTRKSTNASTLLDNKNILDGAENSAYIDGKIAAIEALNAGKSQSDVQAAATAAINDYYATVKSNLIKSWNESVRELHSVAEMLDSHPDTNSAAIAGQSDYDKPGAHILAGTVQEPYSETVDLPDGSTITLLGPRADYDGHYGSGVGYYTITSQQYFYSTTFGAEDELSEPSTDLTEVKYDGETFTYLHRDDWEPVLNKIDTVFQSARDGIILWVDKVTSQVQEGEIEVSELITPRQRAQMMADGEAANQAIADLIALNRPVDPNREATITIDSIGAQFTGTFALTDPADGPLTAGTSYDPANLNGSVYFTTDTSLAEGSFSGYNTVVDNGTVTLTSEPYDGAVYNVTTTDGESVMVDASNFTTTGNGSWTYDASDDLANPATDVSSISFVGNADRANYETMLLEKPFTVESIVNKETGESVSETSFTQSEPQTDSNYLTQEDWNRLEQQNKELIEKYEQSQNSGGGLDLGGLDMFGVPGELVALGAAAVLGFLTLNN